MRLDKCCQGRALLPAWQNFGLQAVNFSLKSPGVGLQPMAGQSGCMQLDWECVRSVLFRGGADRCRFMAAQDVDTGQ